jgi:hypothetical protein
MRRLTPEEIHHILTSGIRAALLAKELEVNSCTIRRVRARLGGKHPERRGWKKPQPPAAFEPASIALPGEEWRAVVGWDRYYRVSNLGRLYSLHQSGRLVTGMPMEGGYRVLKLRDKDRRGHIATHIIVLEAFVGPRPSPAHEGCHNDGNGANNALSNLRWDTAKGNQADRVRHGTTCRGRDMRPKLTAEIVSQIRSRPDVTAVEWARQLGCSRATIVKARRGTTWAAALPDGQGNGPAADSAHAHPDAQQR